MRTPARRHVLTACRGGLWRAGAALALVLAPAVALAAASDHADPAAPAPDPLFTMDDRGPDLPPEGRSLFEFLVAKQVDGRWVLDVPYPFEALTDSIKKKLRPDFLEPIKRVLHPLGRSLHRHDAEPDFFRYPRAIAAVDTETDPGEGDSGLMLRDRFYLGYQPLTDSIEVISYNEAAARFEYQVVTDYREGGKPRVTYADRGVCTACHHNQALIYSQQPWAESNANGAIAALLRLEADSFYGIPAQVPFYNPEQFDEATDRANLFAAHQRAWNQACGAAPDRARAVACRRDGLVSALRFRLSGGYQLLDPGDGARARFDRAVMRGWRGLWPGGVAILSPNLKDFDPLASAGYNSGRISNREGLTRLAAMGADELMALDPEYEPLYPRPPLAVWTVARPLLGVEPVVPKWLDTVVMGLGSFLAAVDLERLDRTLMADAKPARQITVPCHVAPAAGEPGGEGVVFACERTAALGLPMAGRLYAAPDGTVAGKIERTRPLFDQPGAFRIEAATLERTADGRRARFTLRDADSNLTARLGDGNAVLGVTLSWPEAAVAEGGDEGGAATARGRAPNATATLTVADDFARVLDAVDHMAADTLAGRDDALDARPFRRVAVMRPLFDALGAAPVAWCCQDAGHLPPPLLYVDQ